MIFVSRGIRSGQEVTDCYGPSTTMHLLMERDVSHHLSIHYKSIFLYISERFDGIALKKSCSSNNSETRKTRNKKIIYNINHNIKHLL